MIKQTLILLCVLMSVGNVHAWGLETPIDLANESFSWGVDETLNYSTVTNPKWFDESRYLHANDRDRILSPYFRSQHVVDLCISYQICKYVWDDSTSTYMKTACCITIEEVLSCEIERVGGVNYYIAPDNVERHISEAFLIKRYYQEMMNAGHIACAEFESVDEAGDNPDVFGINATADAGHEDLSQIYTGYVTLSGSSEKLLMASQDYGFDMDSIGGEGGSGDIANSLGWGDMTAEGAEHKSVFEIFFYGLIPLLFILLVTKLMLRVNRG